MATALTSGATAPRVNRKVLIAGLAIALPLVAVLVANLGRDPHSVRSPLIGRPAPPFRLVPVGGGAPVALESLHGKPVVINFWASYCPPCRAEMPLLLKDVGQSGAHLVLIDEGEGADAARSFLTELGIHEPTLLDPDMKVGRAYGMTALPMTVFVRANGTIDRRQVGQIDERVLAAELSNLGSQ